MAVKPDLVISYIHPGTVTGSFCASLARTVRHTPRLYDTIELQSSPRIAEARSQVVDIFASMPAEWLLMIDADMVWTPADVELLLSVADPSTRPIVGGLCFTTDGPTNVKPTLYRMLDDGTSEAIRVYPRGELVEVDFTGAAFLLVHRSVFANVKKHYGQRADGTPNPFPWFVECQVDKSGAAMGEDAVFLLRARSLGVPVFVHTGARIGHTKTRVLTEEMYAG